MGLLLPLVLCTLAVCCTTTSVPQQVASHLPFFPHACNDSEVLAIGGLALQDINSNRKEGYVLSLNRVSAVQEHRQDGLGSLFYLTLDVLETDCHVLSKKAWSVCEGRPLHESVYGKCKALFYANKPTGCVLNEGCGTAAYNCTLRPVSRRKIHHMCPDCPSPVAVDLSDRNILEAVTKTLAKFNSESTSQYSLVKVIRASSQWVFGPAYFVTYLIKELPCTKSKGSSCALQSPDSVADGICSGSLGKRNVETFISVNCDFFESEKKFLGQTTTSEEKKFAANQKNTEPTHSPSKALPRGSVQYLPDLDDEETQARDPVEAFPVELNLTTNSQGETFDVSFLFRESTSKKLVVLPFPKEDQRSAECPGPAQNDNPLILPP